MFRTIMIIVGVLIGIALLLGLFAFTKMKADGNKILQFIKDNPERTSIYWVRNEEVKADWHSDKMMPLASTVKIIVAIEYAEQAAQGKINADEMIPLSDLDQYYAKNTDGGAHPAWLKKNADKIVDDKIAIREIAKGMIMFSSNANTEWLCDYLGIDKVNARLDSLGITDHESIYPIVSSLYVGKELFPDLENKDLEAKLRTLSREDYAAACYKIHEILKNDETQKYRDDQGDLAFNIQRVWSDYLISSTTKTYAAIAKKMNSRTYFSPETHEYLNEVMEVIMQNPKNQTWLQHAGAKGGSTAFVLTYATYATDKKGNTTELVYFFDDLNMFTNMILQKSMNDFNLKILSDENFRKEVAEVVRSLKK